jgi:tetratricopeptide (TPR) repeat protein
MTALAISKGFQGLKKEAEESLLRAIALYPANSQAYEILAAYYHSVNSEKEIDILKQQCALFPGDHLPLQILSSRLIQDKRYDDALPYLDKLFAILPNDFFANYQLGQIYRTKKDCATASRYLNTARARASGPEDTKAIQDALSQLQQQCGGS